MRWLECRIPPPLVGLLCAGWMAWLAQRWPHLPFSLPHGLVWGLVAVALLLEGSAVLAFIRQRTTVNPLAPTRSRVLVVSGFYRVSRNPMYLGMLCLLLAWALWLGQGVALLGPLLFAGWITRFQILPEERALRSVFGEAYTDYCQRVRRWV